MLKKPQIVGIMFVIVVFALIATGIKSPVLGTDFEQLTKEEARKRWESSGHGDATAEPYRHWDEDDPANVSNSCARCHSAYGFVDFVETGSAYGTYPAAENVGTECRVCHADPEGGGPRRGITSVTFPSGLFVDNLGEEAICMTCHQGRESKTRIESDIAAAKAAATGTFDDDTVSSKLRFRNIHYFPAGATNLGTWAQGGAEYPEKMYDARFSHIAGYNSCTTCHDPHTLEVRLDHCSTCHTDPTNTSYWGGITDPKNIRFFGSWLRDYDGDGDSTEGIYYEIDTLKHLLWDKIAAYALKINGLGIVHGDGYPYFFIDTNGNGVADESEQERANSYNKWTVRLTRAVYNYQFASKDPGGFAHGGKYLIQLLYDGIEDLIIGIGEPAAPNGITRDGGPSNGDVRTNFRARIQSTETTSNLTRIDEGHFDGSAEHFRHWDEDGEVRGSCARCHSATGLADYLDNGVIDDTHYPSNGMLCTTCHTSPPHVRSVPVVKFPSGEMLSLSDNSNLCITCHQGRASKSTIDNKIAGTPPYSFSNIHYYPVGAVLFGTEAKGLYEYAGKTYAGRRTWANHNGRFDTCVKCHMSSVGAYDGRVKVQTNHNVQKPNPADCVFCHGFDSSQPSPGNDPAKFKFSGIRPGSTPDYNGNGNTEESVKNEIRALEAALYAQMQAYGTSISNPIIYNSHSYPYFFKDTNGNGLVDPGETSRYSFDAAMLKAAYNYQAGQKEPHAYIHNSRYIAQILVDSIADLGGDVSAYTWR